MQERFVPPEKKLQDAEKAYTSAKENREKALEEVGKKKLTGAQEHMSHWRERMAPLMEQALEETGLQYADLNKINLTLSGVDWDKAGNRTLAGTIKGKSGEVHRIEIPLVWPEHDDLVDESWPKWLKNVVIYGHGLVDGKEVDSTLAWKLVQKYLKIAEASQMLNDHDNNSKRLLDEENREFSLAQDLL